MRIAMVGSGGLGGYYGGLLAVAGHAVGFVARGAHLAALRVGAAGAQRARRFYGGTGEGDGRAGGDRAGRARAGVRQGGGH